MVWSVLDLIHSQSDWSTVQNSPESEETSRISHPIFYHVTKKRSPAFDSPQGLACPSSWRTYSLPIHLPSSSSVFPLLLSLSPPPSWDSSLKPSSAHHHRRFPRPLHEGRTRQQPYFPSLKTLLLRKSGSSCCAVVFLLALTWLFRSKSFLYHGNYCSILLCCRTQMEWECEGGREERVAQKLSQRLYFVHGRINSADLYIWIIPWK